MCLIGNAGAMVGQPERAIRVLYGLRASRALAKDVFSFAETRLGCAETCFARFQAAYADVWGCVKMDVGRQSETFAKPKTATRNSKFSAMTA